MRRRRWSCLKIENTTTLGYPLKASLWLITLSEFLKDESVRLQFDHYLICGLHRSINKMLSFFEQSQMGSPREGWKSNAIKFNLQHCPVRSLEQVDIIYSFCMWHGCFTHSKKEERKSERGRERAPCISQNSRYHALFWNTAMSNMSMVLILRALTA